MSNRRVWGVITQSGNYFCNASAKLYNAISLWRFYSSSSPTVVVLFISSTDALTPLLLLQLFSFYLPVWWRNGNVLLFLQCLSSGWLVALFIDRKPSKSVILLFTNMSHWNLCLCLTKAANVAYVPTTLRSASCTKR